MSSLDSFFDQSNNVSCTFTEQDIINQIKSVPIFSKFLHSVESFAEYTYKKNSSTKKKQSLSTLLNKITDDATLYAFIEIQGNGACLYNTVLESLLIQNNGATIINLHRDLEPHDNISITNKYNVHITNFMTTNYFDVNSKLEQFGKQYLSKNFNIILTELDDIALYGFTKSLAEPIQNFQQLANLLANLFNVVIVLFEAQIDGDTKDNVCLVCVAPNQTNNKHVIKQNIKSGSWRIVYVINTSAHYNLVIPYETNTNLLINEFNSYFDKITNKIRFV